MGRGRLISLLVGWLFVATGAALGAPDDCARQSLRTLTQAELDAAGALHRQWVETRDDRQPQGAQADLSWTNLEDLSLLGANLEEANLEGARLDRAKLDAGTIFTNADLRCARLQRLQGAAGAEATTDQANLFQTKLNDADLSGGTILPAAWLVGASLDGANLNSANFIGADFSKATLTGATMISTLVKDAVFSGADLANVVWQPQGEIPDVTTMGDTKGLATLRLDERQPTDAPMAALLDGLRNGGVDARADEVAYALAVARTELRFKQGNWFDGIFRTVFYGWGSGYGLDVARPWLILLGFNLVFLPIYFRFGFRANPARLVRDTGTGPRSLATVKWWPRLGLTTLFWLRTSIAAGIGEFNLPELLGKLIPAVNTIQAKGWLAYVANVQATLSALLFVCAGILVFLRPLG